MLVLIEAPTARDCLGAQGTYYLLNNCTNQPAVIRITLLKEPIYTLDKYSQ